MGFEPTKLSQRCLRPSPLTTRESQLIGNFKLKCSVRGLNSWPWRYKHHALPTELTEQSTSCGTRTRNLRFRRPARYPIALMRQTTCIVFPPPWKDLASPWFEQGPFDKKSKVFFYLLFASLKVATVGFDPTTFGLWARHASSAPRCFYAHRGARTRDHKVKSLALYRLS